MVTKNEYLVLKLKPLTNYKIKVKAIDLSGNQSGYTEAVDVKTAKVLDKVAPKSPTGLKVSDITTTSVKLVWNAAKDNVKTTGYEIYLNGKKVKETPNLNIIIDELVYNTEYSFQVAAYDLAGNLSALSSSLKVTTKDIPRIPPVISNKKSNENLAKLVW